MDTSIVKKQIVWIAVFDKERKHVLLKAFSGGKELGLMDGTPDVKFEMYGSDLTSVRSHGLFHDSHVELLDKTSLKQTGSIFGEVKFFL